MPVTQQHCSRRLQSGPRTLARNEKSINRALERIGNTKGHADDHDQSRGQNHARDVAARPGYGASSSLRNSSNHLQRAGHSKPLESRRHAQCPRMMTTADSPIRNSSGVGSLHADTDRVSRCQMHPIQRPLHIRKAEFAKCQERRRSGVTPKPMLSTTPEKRTSASTAHRHRPACRARCVAVAPRGNCRSPTRCARQSA